jgi:hypothetical protein
MSRENGFNVDTTRRCKKNCAPIQRRMSASSGGGHHNNDDEAQRDRGRQDWLEKEGYRVVRFWNSEISGISTQYSRRFIWRFAVRGMRKLHHSSTIDVDRLPLIVHAIGPSPGGAGSAHIERSEM